MLRRLRRTSAQRVTKIGRRQACGADGHLLGWAAHNNPPALVAGAWADVNDPVARGRDLHVVVDEEDAVAGVDQGVELAEQALDVGRVKAGGRLVEHIEGAAPLGALKFSGQFYPLRLAPRELGRGLSEAEIIEPDLAQHLEGPTDVGRVAEEAPSLLDCQRQHFGDGLAVVGDLERLGIVAGAMTGGARRVNAGQEQQLDHDEPLPFAARATPLGDVEGEPAGVIAAFPGFGRRREQGADMVEQAGVGGEVGPRRAADRLLVNLDQPTDAVQAADDPALGGTAGSILKRGFDIRVVFRRGRGAERDSDQLNERLAHQT